LGRGGSLRQLSRSLLYFRWAPASAGVTNIEAGVTNEEICSSSPRRRGSIWNLSGLPKAFLTQSVSPAGGLLDVDSASFVLQTVRHPREGGDPSGIFSGLPKAFLTQSVSPAGGLLDVDSASFVLQTVRRPREGGNPSGILSGLPKVFLTQSVSLAVRPSCRRSSAFHLLSFAPERRFTTPSSTRFRRLIPSLGIA
jgi:hypothetical protein